MRTQTRVYWLRSEMADWDAVVPCRACKGVDAPPCQGDVDLMREITEAEARYTAEQGSNR